MGKESQTPRTPPESPALCAEDRDTARLVERFQAGDVEAYGTIYSRYLDRVFSYMRTMLKDEHDAEDATQQVFTQVMEALPRYQRRRQPFRAWLFVVARNYALRQLREGARVEVMDPAELDRLREALAAANGDTGDEPFSLGWITDPDLTLFVERLSLPQRQVLLLRFLGGMKAAQIAKVLGRTPNEIAVLQYRALSFLRERLESLDRRGGERREEEMDVSRWPKQARVLRRRRFALWG